jgi:hypothetical protein
MKIEPVKPARSVKVPPPRTTSAVPRGGAETAQFARKVVDHVDAFARFAAADGKDPAGANRRGDALGHGAETGIVNEHDAVGVQRLDGRAELSFDTLADHDAGGSALHELETAFHGNAGLTLASPHRLRADAQPQPFAEGKPAKQRACGVKHGVLAKQLQALE